MKKILLVDDEKELRAAVKIRLEAAGYSIAVASNGKEGLELAKCRKPDLIIMDIMMPVMDGYTAVKKIKEDEELSKIPIIILSIKEKIKMEGLFITDIVDDYIEKPFETEALIAKVRNILGE